MASTSGASKGRAYRDAQKARNRWYEVPKNITIEGDFMVLPNGIELPLY